MKTSELRKLIREEVRKVIKESTAKPLVLTNHQRDLLKALIARQRNQEDEAAHDAVKEALEGIAKDLGLDPTIPFMEDEMFSGSENPKDAYEYAMEMFTDMQAEKGIKESVKPIPNFNTGWEIIRYLDTIPAFKKYRIKGAEYDDSFFEIPVDVFTKTLGWTKEDVDDISNNLESYEGSITWNSTNRNRYKENMIIVNGGA
jgi:hypothetical protein